MSRSIDYSTPAYGSHSRWSGNFGLLTLHRGRLVFSVQRDEVLFDRGLEEVTVGEARHHDTTFDVSTPEGQTWHFAFRADPQHLYFPLTSNPLGVRIEDVDLTDRWAAQDTCRSWVRILADPAAPDPAAWHPDVHG